MNILIRGFVQLAMKINLKIPYIVLFLLLILHQNIYSQSSEVMWQFQTGDRVAASPVIDENVVYVGCENGVFYALDSRTGEELWQVETRGYILGKATVYKNIVFFESSNVYYALDKQTGEELWKFDWEWPIWGYKIDHWDDIRSQAIVYDDVFYIGTSLGALIGLNASDGKQVFIIAKGINSPIRTTPAIHDGKIYFGDWAGKVYCHLMESGELVWERSTYEKRYYDTFGAITSEMVINNGKLYFGARNPQLTVLDAETGEMVWAKNENDSTGGWIVGTPVIADNTLFIGGSDNFTMYAMDPADGREKWTYDCGLNIYTKPVITDNKVIFTAGSAYWYFEKDQNDKMLGGLFIVDRETGKLIRKMDFKEPVFSSPSYHGGVVFFGCYDGNIYAVKI